MNLEQLSPSGDWNGPVDRAQLDDAIRALEAGREPLRAYTTTQIAERIARVAAAWLHPDDGTVDALAESASQTTGYDPALIRWSIVELLRRLSANSLISLVEAELGDREPFVAPRHRGRQPTARGAHPPALLFTVLAGTVPPVAIETISLALLCRAPLLLKTSRAEPHVSRYFLRALREVDPVLGDAVAVMTWPGGQDDLEELAAQRASFVTIYGSDASVDALMQRCRFPTRFLGYGHRVSFGILGPPEHGSAAAAIRRVTDAIALDVAAYDQRGCFSPHCVFVSEQAPWSLQELATTLATESFPHVARSLPRGRLDADVHAAIQQARGVAEFTGEAYPAPDDDALVIVHERTAFQPSPGGRTLHLVPYRTQGELIATLEGLRGVVSSVGLHHATPQRTELIDALGRLGARRITRFGRMQRPILQRHHDGRPRMGDWVEWTDVEPLA